MSRPYSFRTYRSFFTLLKSSVYFLFSHFWKFGNIETRMCNERNHEDCQIQDSRVSGSYSSKCEISNTQTDKIGKIERKHGSGWRNTPGRNVCQWTGIGDAEIIVWLAEAG